MTLSSVVFNYYRRSQITKNAVDNRPAGGSTRCGPAVDDRPGSTTDICEARIILRRMYTVSQKNCAKLFCQNFVKFPPILILFGRKMVKRLKLCELHSISTSPDSRHHITVLNTDVRNGYTTLKVVICSKLSNDLNSTTKVKCGLFSRVISSYNSSVQKCQRVYARSGPHVHKRLDANATENVKPHLQLHGNMSLYRVEGIKMRCCLLFSG